MFVSRKALPLPIPSLYVSNPQVKEKLKLIIFPCYLCPVLNVIVLILPIVTVHISVHTPSTAIKVKLSFLQRSFSLPFMWFTFIATVQSFILIISGLCGHHLGGEAKPGQDPDCLHAEG